MIELAIYALFVAIFRAYFSIKHFLGMQKPFLNLKLHKKIYYFEIGIDVQGLYYMKKQYFLKWKKCCCFFRGTDGFVYKPEVEKSETLYIFNRDLCRSLPLEFHSEMTDSNGIPGYRYIFV